MSNKTILNVSVDDSGKLEIHLAQGEDTVNSMMLIGILEQIKFTLLSDIVVTDEGPKKDIPPKKYDA